MVLFLLADWPEQVTCLTPEEKQYLKARFEQGTEAKKSARLHTVWEALCNREVVKHCLIYFLWISSFLGFNYWMATGLKEISGWSNLMIGWLIVIPMILSLLAIFCGAFFIKKRRKTLARSSAHVYRRNRLRGRHFCLRFTYTSHHHRSHCHRSKQRF